MNAALFREYRKLAPTIKKGHMIFPEKQHKWRTVLKKSLSIGHKLVFLSKSS